MAPAGWVPRVWLALLVALFGGVYGSHAVAGPSSALAVGAASTPFNSWSNGYDSAAPHYDTLAAVVSAHAGGNQQPSAQLVSPPITRTAGPKTQGHATSSSGFGVAAKADVFGRIAATQGARDVGSALPKSFNLTSSAGDNVWVHPNATKHIWEETRGLTFGRRIAEQQRLSGLSGAVDNAVIGRWGEMQVSQGWELIFNAPRGAG